MCTDFRWTGQGGRWFVGRQRLAMSRFSRTGGRHGHSGGMTDWATIAELGTASGTLVLAVATFASVRSANRSARLAEESLLVAVRPLLMPTRRQDPDEKVSFFDGHHTLLAAGHALADVTDEAIYLAMSVRNVGSGMAILHGWSFLPERPTGPDVERPDPDGFRRLTRDLYIPPGDQGFWQGALRDPDEPQFADARDLIDKREAFTVDVLYGDFEGGQRVISRFSLNPAEDGEAWWTAVARHWNIDRPDPR